MSTLISGYTRISLLIAKCIALVAQSAGLLSSIRVRRRFVRLHACSHVRSWSTSESNRCRLPLPHRCARHINTGLSFETGQWVLGRVVAAIVEGPGCWTGKVHDLLGKGTGQNLLDCFFITRRAKHVFMLSHALLNHVGA